MLTSAYFVGPGATMRSVSPVTFVVNSPRPPDEKYDILNEHRPLLIQNNETLVRDEGHSGTGLYRKLARVNWRNVLTITVAVVDYFLVYSSISLIGTFFPTEVIR